MKIVAMIPARMGSQRLPKKNLAPLNGEPLIVHAIRKSKASALFDEIWVNSENDYFKTLADQEGVGFHHRPERLGDNSATSEQFVREFLDHHDCTFVVQVHSIVPLLTVENLRSFVLEVKTDRHDALMSVIDENLECVFDGKPVNFTFAEKTNSQDLKPVKRIVWAVTAWRRETFLEAVRVGACATYAGRVGYQTIGRLAGHVIKTQEDLDIAQALYHLTQDKGVT